ncbi:MAG: site-specific DNA-methyltransferase [Microbacteriaceae bacterium]|nr:site-specific DNA-methyltransferase [Microbacteriaceae bacterium]
MPRIPSPFGARLRASHDDFVAERPPGADEDVHMLPGIVDLVVERCSSPGGVVLDPFAGFGTTLDRAARLGRRAVGVELLPERVEYARRRAPGATVVEGDARGLLRVLGAELPRAPGGVDLVLTSPPYMTANDHPADPLTAYEEDTGDYDRYLRELGLVAAQCARAVRPGGWVVWNVADIRYRGRTTPLIADCAGVLTRHLEPVAIVPIEWDRLPHDLVADALLVVRRPEAITAG